MCLTLKNSPRENKNTESYAPLIAKEKKDNPCQEHDCYRVLTRSKGLVDMSVPNSILDRFDQIDVHIASNLNDALTAPYLRSP